MTLKPTDMLEIQSAIDQYERKFPRRPAPSAVVALAWRLGKKGFAWRQTAQQDAQPSVPGVGSSAGETADSILAEQEFSFGSPLIEHALMLGWWGAVAVMVASVFFFGAMVGGFK
jgi:hypothetical protein